MVFGARGSRGGLAFGERARQGRNRQPCGTGSAGALTQRAIRHAQRRAAQREAAKLSILVWCEQRPAKVRPQHGVKLRRRWRHQVGEISLGGRYCFMCASGASRGRGMRFREGGGVYAGRAEQQSSSKAVELGVAQRVVRCGARCSVPHHRRVQRCEPAPKSEV